MYRQWYWAKDLLTKVNRKPASIEVEEGNLLIVYKRREKGIIFGFSPDMNVMIGLKEGVESNPELSRDIDKLNEVYAYYMGSTVDEIREWIVEIFRSLFSKGRDKKDKDADIGREDNTPNE